MKNRIPLVLAAGALLLAGLAAVAVRARRSRLEAPRSAGTIAESRAFRYAEGRTALRQARERRDALQREVESLRKAERELRAKLPEESAAAPGVAPPSAKDAGLQERMSAMIRNLSLLEMDEDLERLEKRLRLTPEQKARVRSVFLREIEELARALPDNGTPQHEASDDEKTRQALAQILSPAQLAEYDRDQADELRRLEAERIDADVHTLTEALGLNESQIKAAENVLKADPTLGDPIHSELDPLAEAGVEPYLDRVGRHGRRLVAALQPSLSGDQLLKLEEHLKAREEKARELANWVRLFVKEGAPKK
jgi:hypothetical protein